MPRSAAATAWTLPATALSSVQRRWVDPGASEHGGARRRGHAMSTAKSAAPSADKRIEPITDNLPEKITAHAVRGFRPCFHCNGVGHREHMVFGEAGPPAFHASVAARSRGRTEKAALERQSSSDAEVMGVTKQSSSASEIKIHRRRVDCIEGFRLLGAKISPRGVAEADVLVRVGEVRHKRYKARRRAGDGHTVYRWGRLVGAEVVQYGDDPTDFVVVFIPESNDVR